MRFPWSVGRIRVAGSRCVTGDRFWPVLGSGPGGALRRRRGPGPEPGIFCGEQLRYELIASRCLNSSICTRTHFFICTTKALMQRNYTVTVVFLFVFVARIHRITTSNRHSDDIYSANLARKNMRHRSIVVNHNRQSTRRVLRRRPLPGGLDDAGPGGEVVP